VIVLDASVLANVFGDDGPDGRQARNLLSDETAVAIPDLADVETVSVLHRRWLQRTMTAQRFSTAISDLVALPFTRYPARPFLARAYALRVNGTAYDAVYVALAEALGCALVTADQRLARAPGLTCSVQLLIAP